jgi:Stress responsive A/B Barrel Domain
MVSHVVLIKPRFDLTTDERAAMVAALERAAGAIPAIRRVSVGKRVRHGPAYESAAPDTADYVITFDFDDLDGLRAYLAHPAHDALGRLFHEALSAAAYDFEHVPLERFGTLV